MESWLSHVSHTECFVGVSGAVCCLFCSWFVGFAFFAAVTLL